MKHAFFHGRVNVFAITLREPLCNLVLSPTCGARMIQIHQDDCEVTVILSRLLIHQIPIQLHSV